MTDCPKLTADQRQRLGALLLAACADRDLLSIIYMQNADMKRHCDPEALALVARYCESVAAESTALASDPAHASLRDKALENTAAYQSAASQRHAILASLL